MHNFAAQVAGILAEVGLTSTLLELEITESMIMLEEARAARLMDQLHAIGVSIAIDDFGTGYSNFQRLDRKSTRLNSSHVEISYAVFCLKKKKKKQLRKS